MNDVDIEHGVLWFVNEVNESYSIPYLDQELRLALAQFYMILQSNKRISKTKYVTHLKKTIRLSQ